MLEYEVEYSSRGNEGHDILYLLDLVLEQTEFKFDKMESLETLAATITSWETKGRYYTGIKTKEDTVRRVLNIYKCIDEAFSELIISKRETDKSIDNIEGVQE